MTTYTSADRDRLVGSGQTEDMLLWRLIEMAEYDMQSAEIEVDHEAETITIRQTPHMGEARETVEYMLIGEVVERWLTSEQERTSDANVYDYTAAEVDEILETVRSA